MASVDPFSAMMTSNTSPNDSIDSMRRGRAESMNPASLWTGITALTAGVEGIGW